MYKDYNPKQMYGRSDTVQHNGKVYQALRPSVGNIPSDDGKYWSEFKTDEGSANTTIDEHIDNKNYKANELVHKNGVIYKAKLGNNKDPEKAPQYWDTTRVLDKVFTKQEDVAKPVLSKEPEYRTMTLKGAPGRDGISIKGDKGDTGLPGPKGDSGIGLPGKDGLNGIGLQFQIEGTSIGIKREDEDAFKFIDLKFDVPNEGTRQNYLGGGASTRFRLSSVGSGVSLISTAKFRAAELRSLVAGTGMTFDTSNPNQIVLNSSGGGGGGTWGSITGTLSDQTDLQSALDAKYDASNPDSFISGVVWGDITGTLSNQTDLQSALSALIPLTYLDTDVTLAANSDTRIATQKATKAYADQLIAAANATIYKGATDCSTNPNYPAADAGWLYRVSVSGKIGGASGIVVEAGDMFICLTDGTASGTQAAVGANWNVIQANIDGAVIGPTSATDGAFALFDGTTGKLIKNSSLSPSTIATSVSNSDGTLTISPTTGAVVASLALAHANTWTASQIFRPTNSSSIGLVIKAVASQSANIEELQNSSGTILRYADSGGAMHFKGTAATSGASEALLDYSGGGGRFISYGPDASTNGVFSIQSKRSDSSNNYDLLYGTTAGYVGIGTTTPVDRLEVAGAIHWSGTAAASKAAEGLLDYSSGGTRMLLFGPDTSTNSTFKLVTERSNGTNALTQINIGTGLGVFIGAATTPTAILHLAAGTATASTAPLKFTSGTSLTSAEAGTMEFTTDDLFFTITTATARKRLLMADAVGGLTSGRVPFITTNGRLTDVTGFTWDGTNLLVPGSIGSTGTRITKGWFTDLQVTNAIAGSITGNAATVTNATFTTALTVNTGTLTLTANAANTSVLTIGAGAVSISGANTGDQTITLTGAVTGSGTGSFATTIATPGTLTVSSSNSTATAHTHAITSSSAPGAAASILATDASGIIGSTGTRIVKIWATDLTVTNSIAGSVTGSAATLTTARSIYGNNFDGSAALAQIIASTFGGTGNGFTKFSGPATSEKTFTLPNASATILTDNAVVTVAQGGTGLGTLTANNVILGNGTSTPSFVAPGTSGNVLTSNGTTWTSATPSSLSRVLPGGRLTLTSNTPVLKSQVTGATTIYYTMFIHDIIPIYDGAAWSATTFTELSNVTTASSSGSAGPAAVTTNSNYDLFVWNNSSTITLTRGPAWTSDTGRGTGAGTTELQRINGIWTNKIAITNGPAANKGTYVGTVRSDGSSQINFDLGSASAGGGAGIIGLWNMYNRVDYRASVFDNNSSWTYGTAFTPQSVDASNTNRVSYIVGLDEEAISAKYGCLILPRSEASTEHKGFIGVGYDSTTTFSGVVGIHTFQTTALGQGGCRSYVEGNLRRSSGLGYHYIQALEDTNTTTCTFYGSNPGYQAGGLFVEGRF